MTDVKEVVQPKYGEAARSARQGQAATCGCGGSGCCGRPDHLEPLRAAQTARPARRGGARVARLRQSRPRWPSSKPGEMVLDLGSGGGIDVLLSARRVGPTGKAYGLDMTDEMLALARENQREGRR